MALWLPWSLLAGLMLVALFVPLSCGTAGEQRTEGPVVDGSQVVT